MEPKLRFRIGCASSTLLGAIAETRLAWENYPDIAQARFALAFLRPTLEAALKKLPARELDLLARELGFAGYSE